MQDINFFVVAVVDVDVDVDLAVDVVCFTVAVAVVYCILLATVFLIVSYSTVPGEQTQEQVSLPLGSGGNDGGSGPDGRNGRAVRLCADRLLALYSFVFVVQKYCDRVVGVSVGSAVGPAIELIAGASVDASIGASLMKTSIIKITTNTNNIQNNRNGYLVVDNHHHDDTSPTYPSSLSLFLLSPTNYEIFTIVCTTHETTPVTCRNERIIHTSGGGQ